MLQTFDKNTGATDIADALRRDGGAIVANQVSNELVDKVKVELRPHLEREGHKYSNDFNGYKTLRLGAILALSRTAAELIAHPSSVCAQSASGLPELSH